MLLQQILRFRALKGTVVHCATLFHGPAVASMTKVATHGTVMKDKLRGASFEVELGAQRSWRASGIVRRQGVTDTTVAATGSLTGEPHPGGDSSIKNCA